MKKALLFAAAALVSASAFAQDALYVIGDNVNGNSWMLADPTAQMTDKGNGIWTVDLEYLGTGFKINDGTWTNEAYNIGAITGNDVYLGEPYFYSAAGSSGNFAFAGFTALRNAHIELNFNDQTITCSGDAESLVEWFLAGVNGDFDFATMPKFTEKEDGIYEIPSVTFEETEEGSKIKVVSTGWATQYGTNDAENVFFTADNLSNELELVGGEGGNVSCEMLGTYKVIWDSENWVLTFEAAVDGVEGVAVDANAPVVYYNLQGVRVANPENGIFVKVADGKAEKVVK